MNVTLPFEIAEGANGFHYAAHPHISASHYGTTAAAKKAIRAHLIRHVDAALDTHANSYQTRAVFVSDLGLMYIRVAVAPKAEEEEQDEEQGDDSLAWLRGQFRG